MGIIKAMVVTMRPIITIPGLTGGRINAGKDSSAAITGRTITMIITAIMITGTGATADITLNRIIAGSVMIAGVGTAGNIKKRLIAS